MLDSKSFHRRQNFSDAILWLDSFKATRPDQLKIFLKQEMPKMLLKLCVANVRDRVEAALGNGAGLIFSCLESEQVRDQ